VSSASFSKRERICSTRLIDALFGSGSCRTAVYPLRAVYRLTDRQPDGMPVQILISVPKKCFKHAVDRNRVKRQVREAFRRLKQPLASAVAQDKSLLIAFIWMSNRQAPSAVVYSRIEKLLTLIGRKTTEPGGLLPWPVSNADVHGGVTALP